MIEIREEHAGDVAAIRELNRLAFGQDQEGNIVDALRANGAVTLSLVATLNGRVVGHILYSALTINDLVGAGLGPMAVSPEHQRQGIGSKLVKAGNERLETSDVRSLSLSDTQTSIRDSVSNPPALMASRANGSYQMTCSWCRFSTTRRWRTSQA